MKDKIDRITVETFEIFGRGVAIVRVKRFGYARVYDDVTPSSFRRAQRAQAATMNMGKGEQ